MSGSKMEIDRENEEDDLQLQSKSTPSVSSSILNTDNDGDDNDDSYDDDDDYEDGINVTLLSSPPSIQVPLNPEVQLNTSTQEIKRTTKIKLSGAGQKRFKRLVESGYSRKDAHLLALIPSNDSSKRQRNTDLNGSNTSGNPTPAKIARNNGGAHKPQVTSSNVQNRLDAARSGLPIPQKGFEGKIKPSYRDVTNYVKLGVLPKGYPDIELSTEQLTAIQKDILKKVAGQRKELLKPKFGNCVLKSGYLIIVCKNQETADWLKSIIPSVNPWAGAQLLAVEEKDIPRPEILIGFFPLSAEDSNEEILALLESQNDGLAVDTWRVLQRNVKNQHVELVFTVDGGSLNSIKKSDFSLDFKFGYANLRKKYQKRNEEGSSERPELRDGCDSHKTHTSTGDGIMVVDQSAQIPGPSGVKRAQKIPKNSGHATSIGIEKNTNTTKNEESALGYRDLKIQGAKCSSKGSRRTNVGAALNPRPSGEPDQIQP
ncbi:uncharacterized protein LOC134288180 [Aedes albopictus]|uniref:DUF4780 domain-containing protein n=1 Tax=Aedes albopictus TaxID=7160 RepID=A0ABM1YK70_AEDAL